MANENQLEDTSDSILPIKNGLGIPSEVFSEIIQEFNRACKSKSIDKHLLVHYMDHRSSWQIKCVAIGSVSNVFINMGPEGDQYLNLLQNIGEDLVVDEVIRTSLDDSGNKNTAQRDSAKKSTTKIPNTKSSPLDKKKDSQGNISKPLEYHNAKSGNNVLVLGILAALGIVLAIVGFVLFQKSNSKSGYTSNAIAQPTLPTPTSETKIETNEKPVIKASQKPIITEQRREMPTVLPFAGNMIIPEGVLVYQNGYDNFIGGEIVTLSSHKRKNNTSPFFVGNHTGISYTIIKYDLRNIPSDASIESAMLNINVTTLNDNNSVFNLYCLPVSMDWSYNTIVFNKEGSSSEISYDGLIKKISAADKVAINLRNDWISFNTTSIVQEWISKKSNNNGFILFTDSASDIIFDGFDSNKKMISPKLVLSFGKAPKEKETAKNTEPKPLADLKPIEKEKDEPPVKENKPKEVTASIADKEKAEDEDVNTLENFGSKPAEEKPSKDKKNAKSVLDDDGNNPTKNKEKEEPSKAKQPVNNNPPKIVEKVETVKNDEAVDVTMKDPVILPLARLLEAADTVKLENPEGKGELRYTIDGKDPSADSYLYSEPIKLSGNQLHVVKSAIFLDRVRKSSIKAQEFRMFSNQAQIIDNISSNCRKTGNWESSKSKANFYGKDYIWEQKGKGTVEWYPNISKKSQCEVYIWIPDGDSVTRSDKTKYVVKFDGGTKDIFIDQTTRGNKWIFLGTFAMKAGACSVTLYDDGSGKMFVADAACFYFLPDVLTLGN